MSFWDYVIPGYKAAEDAGQAQSEAADRARAAIAKSTKEATKRLDPYADTGKAARFTLADLAGQSYTGKKGSIEDARSRAMEGFYKDPGYDWAMEQGSRARLYGQAASGRLHTGETEREMTDFGQGLANQQYQNWLKNLGGLSTTGYQASTQQGMFGVAGGRQEAAILDRQGAYNASIPVGQANAVTGLLDFGKEVAGTIYGKPADPQQTAGLQRGSGYAINPNADKNWYGNDRF